MRSDLIYKILTFTIIALILLPISQLDVSAYEKMRPINGKLENIEEMTFFNSELEIRKPGGDWEDQSITVEVGTELQFRIKVSSDQFYSVIAIFITLPLVKGEPMFEYIERSASPIPDTQAGNFDGTDTLVSWGWFNIEQGWSEVMTFNAKILKANSKSVKLAVYGLAEDFYDEYDSVRVNGKEKEKNCIFTRREMQLKNLVKAIRSLRLFLLSMYS